MSLKWFYAQSQMHLSSFQKRELLKGATLAVARMKMLKKKTKLTTIRKNITYTESINFIRFSIDMKQSLCFL